jgi:DNA-binding SARP family transcriptional activator/tetratricopeptide (TPR) repeat protein
VLGPLQAWHGGAQVRLGTPQAKAVLGVLLLACGEVVPRDRIADELWGDSPPASAKVQIQGLISHLRRVLPHQSIATRGTGYVLCGAARDDQMFADQVTFARKLIDDGQLRAGSRMLTDALALWRGRYLADIDGPAVRSAAEQWEELRLEAIEAKIAADIELGQSGQVAAELTDLIAEHPLRERLRGLLMTALAKAGRVADALRAYRDWQTQLRDELGVDPSPDLRALHGGILRAEPGLRPASHYRRPGVARQLPADLPDFVGRQDLLAELGQWPSRVLVISGAGGIGKTSLAVRLAHQVSAQFPDGQLFVTLRETTTMTVLIRFLRALGVPPDVIPTADDECVALFRDMLVGRRVLVVLDDACDDRQIKPLLPDEPGCAVIVTSRNELRTGRLTRLGALPDDDAMTLVGNRCLVELSRGMPLALRLAGRITAIRSAPVNRDPIRSSFLLSYQELDQRTRTLFQGLGLLPAPDVSGWVADALVGTNNARPLLDDLVSRHMVQEVGPDRYRLHDLLRAFAKERAPDRRDAVTRALGGWLWLAESAADKMPGNVLRPRPGTAPRWVVPGVTVTDPLAWFDAEHLALESAIDLAADRGMGEMAWELAAVCASYFEHRGLFGEWLRCHTRALAAARASGCDRGAAALLRGIGQLHIFWDNYPEATAAMAESLRISELISDRIGIGRALAGQGIVCRELARFDDAATLFRRALTIFTAAGDLQCAAQVLNNLAMASMEQGRFEEAQTLADEAFRLCVELGDEHRMANVMRVHGRLCLHRNDPAAAVGHLGRALEIVDSMGDQRCTAHSRMLLGHAYAMLGDPEAARNALRSASLQFVLTGNGRSEATCARMLGELDASRPASRV